MTKLLLILIVFASLFLKIWKGSDLFFWNVDEDIIALTVKRILVDFRPQLIGFPIPGGIYLGPLFYYIVSIPYLLSVMNPLNLYFFSAGFGVLSTFLVYKVGKIIFGRESVGILSAIIFGFSYLANTYSRVLTGLTFAPIIALLTYFILFQNLKRRKPKNLLWLSIVLLGAMQNEGSSISLVILAIVIFITYKLTFPLGKFLIAVILFLVFHIPLLLFDLRHKFFLTKSFLSFFGGNIDHGLTINLLSAVNSLEIFPRTLSRLLVPTGPAEISSQILPCENLVLARISSIQPVIYIFAIIIIGFFVIKQIFKKKKIYGERIVLAHFGIMTGGIILYNLFLVGYSFEWVTVVFFPGFAFMTAFFLAEILKKMIIGKFIVLSLLIAFIMVNVKTMFNTNDRYSLGIKSEAVKFALSNTGQRDFYFESLGDCFGQGYLYLFWYFGQLPKNASGIIYDTAFFQSGDKPDLGVIMVHDKQNLNGQLLKYETYKKHSLNNKEIGGIEIIIVDRTQPLE